jgi:PAS domain S-box-containing protein
MMSSNQAKTILIIEEITNIIHNETTLLEKAGYNIINVSPLEYDRISKQPNTSFQIVLIEVGTSNQLEWFKISQTMINNSITPLMFIISSELDTKTQDMITNLNNYGIIQRGCSTSILLLSINSAIRHFNANKQHLKTEQNLIKSEKYTKAIFNAIGTSVFVHTDQNNGFANFREVNTGACDRYGYTKEEFLKLNALDISVQSTQKSDYNLSHLEQLRKHGRMVSESLHITKSGQIFPVELNSSIFNIQGTPTILTVVHDISSQKQVENDLAKNESKFRQLFENSPIALWREDFHYVGDHIELLKTKGITDFKSYFKTNKNELLEIAQKVIVLQVNQRAVQLFKAKSSKELLVNIARTFTQKTIATFLDLVVAYANGYTSFESQAEMNTLVGNKLDVIIKAKFGLPESSKGANDHSKGIISIIDISSQKETERALKESEKNFRLLFENSPLGIFIANPDGKIIDGNFALLNILGSPSLEATKNINLLKFPPLVENGYADKFLSCIESGETIFFQMDYKSKWGKISNLSNYLIPLKNSEGKVEKIYTLMEDRTSRHQAQKALKESEERYRLFFETNQAAILMIDPQTGIIIYANKAAIKFYGYTSKELVGMPIKKINTLTPEQIKLKMAKAMESSNNRFVFKHRIASGETRDVEIYESKLILNGEKVISIMVHDITDRQLAEKEKKSLERQMQHSQKLESLGVLAGGIAHDFNNLLMVILGNTNLVMEVISQQSPAYNNMEEILNASRRAADLSKQMLAYSGKGSFIVESIQLNDLVEEMVNMLEISISKKAILKQSLLQYLPRFDGDPTQVRQIIMNLITNASDAIGNKSGTIKLSTGIKDCNREYLDNTNEVLLASMKKPLPTGHYVYIEVSDTGCGMDKQTIEKIFDPFFTTKFTGRGLGMAAVLGIVKGLGGAIKVHSQLDIGTTFTILFPATTISQRGESNRNRRSTLKTSWLGKGTILIVDDEKSIRVVGSKMLEKIGFNVLTASDGIEAIAKYKEHHEDIVCILLDLTMPNMDGIETFHELHKINPDFKVILCSGYNQQDATESFPINSLNGFLKKPFSLGKLQEVLKKALDSSQ